MVPLASQDDSLIGKRTFLNDTERYLGDHQVVSILERVVMIELLVRKVYGNEALCLEEGRVVLALDRDWRVVWFICVGF